MRRILLIGAAGQVGWELQRTLAPLGSVISFNRSDLDLADLGQLRSVLRELRPTLIVNAAAYTAVDHSESEPELAWKINAEAPRVMAEEADRLGSWFIHYSTDYVFNGTKSGPYFEDDPTDPVSAYGRSKLGGEHAVVAATARHVILRTSWVYANRGKNFLLTMLKLGRERDELRIVDDQRGAPTWARVIAEATSLCGIQVLRDGDRDSETAGIYHLTCAGTASWYEFAGAIFDRQPGNRCPKLVPIPTAEYPMPARRPLNSTLDGSKLTRVFGIEMPSWRTALGLCLNDSSG